MPKGTRVHRCVEMLVGKGMSKGRAIATCQESTNQSYATGKTLRKKKRGKSKK